MAIRVRYKPTDLSEGVVETLPGDSHCIMEDNSIAIFTKADDGTMESTGSINGTEWCSVIQVDEEATAHDE